MKLDLFPCWASARKSPPQRRIVANISAKKLNCIVPQTVCLLSKVNRYTAELSFGSLLNTLSQRAQMSTEVSIKLFTRRRIKCQDRRRCSVSISLNFYQTILESSLQTKFLFNIKKLLLLIIDAQTLFPGKQRTTCLPKFRKAAKHAKEKRNYYSVIEH